MNIITFLTLSVTTQTEVLYGALLYVDNTDIFVDSTAYCVDGSDNMIDISYP